MYTCIYIHIFMHTYIYVYIGGEEEDVINMNVLEVPLDLRNQLIDREIPQLMVIDKDVASGNYICQVCSRMHVT
jgi:hypothetical protein